MKFRTAVTASKEVLFVGHERGNSRSPQDWALESGRWKIDIALFDELINVALEKHSFGTSIELFVFGFEIGELDAYGDWFQATVDYTSYKPKKKELLSVGQLNWSMIKDLAPREQLEALRRSVISAILRVGAIPRKPKDFDFVAFANTVDTVIAAMAPTSVAAHPASE
jgi:hypothetical protein